MSRRPFPPPLILTRSKFLLKTASVSPKRLPDTARQHDLPFRPLNLITSRKGFLRGDQSCIILGFDIGHQYQWSCGNVGDSEAFIQMSVGKVHTFPQSSHFHKPGGLSFVATRPSCNFVTKCNVEYQKPKIIQLRDNAHHCHFPEVTAPLLCITLPFALPPSTSACWPLQAPESPRQSHTAWPVPTPSRMDGRHKR